MGFSFQGTRIARFWATSLFNAALIGSGIFSGCTREKEGQPSGETQNELKTEEPILIGLSLSDLKEERWQRDRDYFTAKAESLGAKVLVQDASGDPNAQLRQCDGMLAKGVKVLVVVPKNADAARPIVMNAHARGVKVISYDRLIADAPVDLELSFDNEKVGEIQAKTVLAAAPKGDYLVLKGDPADKNSDMIHRGHLNILQPAINRGDIRLAVVQSCDKWLRSEAARITADALQKHTIAAVVASNDGTASGAISALQAKGIAGKVPVSGQDADLIACQYVWQGLQTVTVYKPIKKLAEVAAEQAVKAAKGEAFDAAGAPLSNGEYSVPALFLEPVAVQKENLLATVVADGFHSEEAVTGVAASQP
jgi:D-xylose transport system substrate-binding protein